MRCPSCKTSVADDAPQKPFCSERCRLIDLGSWLDGTYRIAGERNVDEVGTDGEPPDLERDR